MEKCFVIQPFDDGKFDKRFVDVFQPAIIKADMEAYRIDKDLSVRVPIDEIEKGISECSMCFAEITTDNPNVWYELGFAFACNKDVVMVCSDERVSGKYPFDIQHRQIISYTTSSPSDFATLGDSITKKIKALRQKSTTTKQLNVTPLLETEGLTGHEIALLILIMEDRIISTESTSLYAIKNEMEKSGYTDIATGIGIRTLVKKGLVKTFIENDNQTGEPYNACVLTYEGEEWLLSNREQLKFRKS